MIYRQLSSCSACVSAHSFQLQATTFILARFLAPGGHQLGALPVRGRKWPAGGESVAQKKAGGFRRGPRPSRLDCRAWPGERGKATPLVRLNSLACLSETPKYAKYAFDFTKDNCKIGNFDHLSKKGYIILLSVMVFSEICEIFQLSDYNARWRHLDVIGTLCRAVQILWQQCYNHV